MKQRFWRCAGYIFVWAGWLSICACAGMQEPVSIRTSGEGQRIVNIQADNFKFEPNHIRISQTGPLTLQINNVSDHTHNFTIKSPGGDVLKSIDLPPGQQVQIEIDLPEPGKYPFHCDKPFHTTLGMAGQIVVAEGK